MLSIFRWTSCAIVDFKISERGICNQEETTLDVNSHNSEYPESSEGGSDTVVERRTHVLVVEPYIMQPDYVDITESRKWEEQANVKN
jgi:hypothetical protein